DDGRREEGADAANAEEPADGSGAQMRGIKLAGIDGGRSVGAGIDPADEANRHIHPKAALHGEPEMERGADEIIEEENGPAAETVDQESAGGIAEHRA